MKDNYPEGLVQCAPVCEEESSYLTGLKRKDFGSLAFGTPIFCAEENIARATGNVLGYFCGICPQGYVYYTPKPVKQEDFYKEFFSGKCTIKYKYWAQVFVSRKAVLEFFVREATGNLAQVQRYKKGVKKEEEKLIKIVEKLKKQLHKEK